MAVRSRQLGFTIIELFVVFVLISVSIGILIIRTGTYSYWRQESFIRQLSDTLVFLHHQAISDQAFYQMEFDFDANRYAIGIIAPEYHANPLSAALGSAGRLSQELAYIISPAVGRDRTLVAPPSFPTLGVPVELPAELVLTEIRTMRGKHMPTVSEKPYILFSPRGFSEFAVIHLETGQKEPITILINPFSGNTEIYREYKDFEWTYGQKN